MVYKICRECTWNINTQAVAGIKTAYVIKKLYYFGTVYFEKKCRWARI